MRHAGYTLVEMMVVVAIIAVLAAILIPVVFSARDGVLRAQCIAQLDTVGRALAMYRQDCGAYPAAAAPMQTLVNAKLLDPDKLTCPKDDDAKKDSYSKFYNYWGYRANSWDPDSLVDAADAKFVYTTLTNPKTGQQDFWVMPDDTLAVARRDGFGADFPGLVNPGAKNLGHVIVTVCPRHASGKYVILRLGGEVEYAKPTDENFWALSTPSK
ncbi:MAG TPA: prepilin-type N-terminal cleavage/methylation domain-containing protein [Armatimonadota bacterium]|nr:prepilin-type N-terminal cleavage/methylation domain-containing protein [Armatimonadota bacterium]HOS43289.1 prepilin-type N-terminal cleavage/methylation domain-containing protein [Armatimonadota bacterium]